MERDDETDGRDAMTPRSTAAAITIVAPGLERDCDMAASGDDSQLSLGAVARCSQSSRDGLTWMSCDLAALWSALWSALLLSESDLQSRDKWRQAIASVSLAMSATTCHAEHLAKVVSILPDCGAVQKRVVLYNLLRLQVMVIETPRLRVAVPVAVLSYLPQCVTYERCDDTIVARLRQLHRDVPLSSCASIVALVAAILRVSSDRNQ